MTPDEQKRETALAALDYVEDGMKLGLGTGSTAVHFVDVLGARVAEGLNVLCVPTSKATHAQAAGLNIPLSDLDETPELDLTVDGADEFDDDLCLIKGGGGALLREKIVAQASKRMIVIADESKKVATLGAFALPVEVVSFGVASTLSAIEREAGLLGCKGDMSLRLGQDGALFQTDGGNLICDCAFGIIPNPRALASALNIIPGVVENGLFIDLCDLALLGTNSGVIEITVKSNK